MQDLKWAFRKLSALCAVAIVTWFVGCLSMLTYEAVTTPGGQFMTANAMIVGQSGARCFDCGGDTPPPDPETYAWMDSPVGYTDHWVDPEKVTNGTTGCPEIDPCQFSQLLAFNPAGGRHRFILLPGTLNVTTTFPGDSKMPVLQPQFSGTEANPVLVKAQYSATNSSTTPEQRTVIRRTTGSGSILGASTGIDYWSWDGIYFPGGVGSEGGCEFCGGNENAVLVLRSASGWSFTRFWIDGEYADWTEQSSTNGGGVYMQLVDHILLQDFIIEDVGDPALSTDIWQGVEMYDATDVEVGYFTMRDIFGLGVHMKGAPAVDFARNRIHHGWVDNAEDSGISALYVSQATPADYNYWWNIVVTDSTHGLLLNAIEPHSGSEFQNITIVGSNEGVAINRAIDVEYLQASLRNSVVYNNATAIIWVDGTYDADITFNYNRYNTFPSRFMNSSAGNWTYATWRTNSGQDGASDTNVPVFTNSGADDWTTAASEAADAPDTLGVYGTPDAMVRRGAWQPVGVRTVL